MNKKVAGAVGRLVEDAYSRGYDDGREGSGVLPLLVGLALGALVASVAWSLGSVML